MYAIEHRAYGIKITLAGHLGARDLERWLVDLRTLTTDLIDGYGVVVDARDLDPLPDEAVTIFASAIQILQARGALRADVVANDPGLVAQLEALTAA